MMSEVTLERLRRDHPGYEWTAERCGRGWRYLGSSLREDVVVRPVSAFEPRSERERVIRVWLVDTPKGRQVLRLWEADQAIERARAGRAP